MKLTESQIRNIVRQEIKRGNKKVFKEYGSMNKEVMSPLVDFARAWSGLGDAVQSQMIDVINGYIENNEEAVYEINPNALEMATDRLARPLDMLRGSEEAEEIMGALDWAAGIFKQGEEEVERDARAAGDR